MWFLIAALPLCLAASAAVDETVPEPVLGAQEYSVVARLFPEEGSLMGNNPMITSWIFIHGTASMDENGVATASEAELEWDIVGLTPDTYELQITMPGDQPNLENMRMIENETQIERGASAGSRVLSRSIDFTGDMSIVGEEVTVVSPDGNNLRKVASGVFGIMFHEPEDPQTSRGTASQILPLVRDDGNVHTLFAEMYGSGNNPLSYGRVYIDLGESTREAGKGIEIQITIEMLNLDPELDNLRLSVTEFGDFRNAGGSKFGQQLCIIFDKADGSCELANLLQGTRVRNTGRMRSVRDFIIKQEDLPDNWDLVGRGLVVRELDGTIVAGGVLTLHGGPGAGTVIEIDWVVKAFAAGALCLGLLIKYYKDYKPPYKAPSVQTGSKGNYKAPRATNASKKKKPKDPMKQKLLG